MKEPVPSKYIAQWAAVPQPEDGHRHNCDLNVGDLQSLCQNQINKEKYVLGQLLEDELALNNESVPMNDYRAEQSLWRKCKHIHIYIYSCAIPQNFREKSTFPIEDWRCFWNYSYFLKNISNQTIPQICYFLIENLKYSKDSKHKFIIPWSHKYCCLISKTQ